MTDLPSIEEIDRELARREPADFAILASRGRWKMARHLKLLNEKLLALAEGRIKRLIVTCPPRHGKSLFCSQYFPAWYLGKHPDNRVIFCSYEAEFAASWGGKARDILEEYGATVFGVTVREDARARNDWKTHRPSGEKCEGGMVTAGAMGAITGKGANLLIVDDPVKNAEDAASATIRQKTWDWWQSTAYTRLEPDASVLIIQTRWHDDDLTGKLLRDKDDEDDAADDEKWEVINLPALAEANDPIGRQIGEALWPERYSVEKLQKRKRRVGSFFWAALYQQRPSPEEGGKFRREWFRYYKTDGEFYRLITGKTDRVIRIDECLRFMSGDIAGTDKQRIANKTSGGKNKSDPDYTVFTIWDMTPRGDLILVDMWRGQREEPEVVRAGVAIMRKHDAAFALIEKNGVGLGVVSTMRLRSVSVRAVVAKTDKIIRAQTAMVRFEAGMMYFPVAGMTLEVESELLGFPNAAHDDIVDTVSLAAIQAQRMHRIPLTEDDEQHIEGQVAEREEAELAELKSKREEAMDRQWAAFATGEDDGF